MSKPQDFPSEPKKLWDVFYDFTQTPRPSKHEEKIQEYLIDLAKKHSFECQKDSVGNIIMYVPGKNGREDDEPVLVQNHIDMVTDSLPEVQIDFKNDPIETFMDDGWLKAKGTTLGADNGIGCAAALAIALDESAVHPPLELLFTVDEETGLNGALGLESKYFKAKKMLNLDTEEWGSLYIGCAGGIDYQFERDFELENKEEGESLFELKISGLVGGHSGLDIQEQRGNAIKMISEYLSEALNGASLKLAELRGGRAHNIIPRDAFAKFYAQNTQSDRLKELAQEMKRRWLSYLPKEDQNFEIEISQTEATPDALSFENTSQFIQFASLFPHGAHAYDLASGRKLVGMSNNMARLLLVRGKAYAQTSVRFFDREEAKKLELQLKSLGKVFGYKVESASEYPSWKPVLENPVLETVKGVYKETFNEEAEVTAIHAGLECGILKDKIGKIDVVSFGPTIMGAHSPDERVDVASVEKFWLLFKNVMEKI
ncbi:MAG: aminoacyl-histidine dipeptidase [Halobacteriovoraceae bacterium]|nr:aminoacyl-histidine dipeptidase [Halobacteriovoraceae bacterium]|tara:strand:+ start:1950 stop:3407 length:1458 start_codon:yes stop_codon:yes gene_type:complete